MKQVLFEEDGGFRVGTILSEAGAAFQVEAAHGKRSKVKANAVLLRFDGQSLGGFMPEAQSRAQALDPQFLWEVCGSGEFGFAELGALDPPAITRPERYWLIVETADEVLDYREAVAYYAGAFQSVVQGGDHSLTSFPEFVPDLVAWAREEAPVPAKAGP